jgi:F-type H+-transporting ATPase subunit gamma
MERMLSALTASLPTFEGAPVLLAGTGKGDVHLLVVVSADRGLCGGFNNNIVRETRRRVTALQRSGKQVKILFLGRKARDPLRRQYQELIVDTVEGLARTGVAFESARDIALRITEMAEAGEFDVCSIIYNQFKSVISQVVTEQQIIPFPVPEVSDEPTSAEEGTKATYEMEPSEEEMLADLLPRNLSVQMFRALLESFASEQGARMTAMDNATRNAGEMIDRLTMTYNRTRQAAITKELIEIISGAEAV